MVIKSLGKLLVASLLTGFLMVCAPVSAQTNLPVTQVAACTEHALFTLSNGSLWVIGENDYGELGTGSIPSLASIPAMILSSNVTAVSTGFTHSAFIKSDGSLWLMGNNNYGQLGDGTTNAQLFPKQIVPSGVVQVSCGSNYTLYQTRTLTGTFPHQTTTASLYGFGYNGNGQLGDGTTNNHLTSFLINSSNTITVTPFSAGSVDSIFVKANGTMWGMGYNVYGELGDGTTNQRTSPEVLVNAFTVIGALSSSARTFFIQSDNSLWAAGANGGALGDGTVTYRHNFVKVATNVVSVTSQDQVTAFVKGDGTLWATGDDSYGQFCDGPHGSGSLSPRMIFNDVTAAALNDYLIYFIRSDGSLWGAGLNVDDQLGDGFPSLTVTFPEQIYPLPSITIDTFSVVSKTNLQFTGSCGLGGNYYLLASTNVSLPKASWTRLLTNEVDTLQDGNYNATLTNGFRTNNPRRFFALQHQ